MELFSITLNPLEKADLLQGLKRGLEISPAGAVVLVMSRGVVSDYNDAGLLKDIHTLLDEKQSQVIIITDELHTNSLIEKIFKDIASKSFGFYIPIKMDETVPIMDNMELLLLKPVNCYERILEVTVNAPEYVQEFNTAESDYLLVTSSGNLNVRLTDPNGNHATFSTYLLSFVDTYLIKYPANGIWRIEITGKDKLLSLRIFAFTGLRNLGNCLDVQCDPDATCEDIVGYEQPCTCKEGFIGNGLRCSDIDECKDEWWHPYFYTSCINSIGSYMVSCLSGYIYKEKDGCIDIDECARDYPNDCHPLAGCINTYGSYTCYCPSGYFGDGKQCVVNECLQSAPCHSSTDCIKDLTTYTCVDPCSSYANLARRISRASNKYYSSYYDPYSSGWYGFEGEEEQIPEYCLPSGTCDLDFPIWLNGTHPTIDDGIVSLTACVYWYGQCCAMYFPLSVKACPGGYYVYKLTGRGASILNYCTKSDYSCSDMNCFPDEECRDITGVSECQCSDAIYYKDGSEQNSPADLVSSECRLDQIKVTFRTCLLERMGYNSSSLHLRDSNCEGVMERTDRSYVVITTMPENGHCGTYLEVNHTHWTYTNEVYLSPKSNETLDDYTVTVSCSYVINMENLLWLTADTFISEGNLTIGGSAIYPVRMGFFKDSSYTVLYEGPTVWLRDETNLYVGISVKNEGNSQVVLVIKNCYATVISERGESASYDIMNDYCPNMIDSTLSVLENGVSSQGRFQLQTSGKFGKYRKMYLHCQVHLCNTKVDSCLPICSESSQTFTSEGAKIETITLGPLYGTDGIWIITAWTIRGHL